MKPVLVIGGGLSGLAAAVELSRAGVPILVLEGRPHLGGRAYSFRDRASGQSVDNGQHILIAGYQATLEFLTTIGTLDRLNIQQRPSFVFHHPERGFRTLKLPPLPSPVHLFAGIARSTLFSTADKPSILRAGSALLRPEETFPAEWTVLDWLTAQGQGRELRRSFWEPLAMAIMNEQSRTASARVFIRSLRKAFLGGWRGASLAIPKVGLSDLYTDAARWFIIGHKGDVRTGAAVKELEMENDDVTTVRLDTGAKIECSAVVLAIPPWDIPGLLPVPNPVTMLAETLKQLPASPIISMHLWFPSMHMPYEIVGVIDKNIQWVFRHTGYVSVTISAAGGMVEQTNTMLLNTAVKELREIFGAGIKDPSNALIIRERRATFSCSPRVDKLRPGPETPIRNLFLAGDWTNTGLPATMESAVISGKRAAAAVQRFQTKTQKTPAPTSQN